MRLKVRFSRKLLFILMGSVAVLGGGSGAAAVFIGTDKFLGPSYLEVNGLACTVRDTVKIKKGGHYWVRKYVVGDEPGDGIARVKTALRVARAVQEKEKADVVLVAMLDKSGPKDRAEMRGRRIGAQVVYIPDTAKAPAGIKAQTYSAYYVDGMAASDGEYYGMRMDLPLEDVAALDAHLTDKADCVDPVVAVDPNAAPAAHGAKPKKGGKSSGSHGAAPAAGGHGAPAPADAHGAAPAADANAAGGAHGAPAADAAAGAAPAAPDSGGFLSSLTGMVFGSSPPAPAAASHAPAAPAAGHAAADAQPAAGADHAATPGAQSSAGADAGASADHAAVAAPAAHGAANAAQAGADARPSAPPATGAQNAAASVADIQPASGAGANATAGQAAAAQPAAPKADQGGLLASLSGMIFGSGDSAAASPADAPAAKAPAEPAPAPRTSAEGGKRWSKQTSADAIHADTSAPSGQADPAAAESASADPAKPASPPAAKGVSAADAAGAAWLAKMRGGAPSASGVAGH